jgi:hypothetical protein
VGVLDPARGLAGNAEELRATDSGYKLRAAGAAGSKYPGTAGRAVADHP